MFPELGGEMLYKNVLKDPMYPLLCFSAEDSLEIKLDMLLAGAHGYICKLIVIEELLCRVHV